LEKVGIVEHKYFSRLAGFIEKTVLPLLSSRNNNQRAGYEDGSHDRCTKAPAIGAFLQIVSISFLPTVALFSYQLSSASRRMGWVWYPFM
jgi:hypothetical protein